MIGILLLKLKGFPSRTAKYWTHSTFALFLFLSPDLPNATFRRTVPVCLLNMRRGYEEYGPQAYLDG